MRPAQTFFHVTLALFTPGLFTACASDRAQTREAPPALREAIQVIETNALDADQKDWRAVERRVIAELGPDADADAYRRAAIAALGDPHASYMSAAEVERWRHPPVVEPTPAAPDPRAAAPAPPAHPEIPDLPWALSLPNAVGYLGLPPCTSGDPDRLQEYGLALRRHIAALGQAGATRWIVDLRLDGGGNVWPMITGLAPLLGDGPVTRSYARAPDGRSRTDVVGLEGDSAWLDQGAGRFVQFTLRSEGTPLRPTRGRIAVLLGPWTMSSGELTAFALASSPASRSFGEPTGGLTTATSYFPLTDGAVLVLPVSRMATIQGPPARGPISPDEAVAFGDWPAADDATVAAAQAWLEGP